MTDSMGRKKEKTRTLADRADRFACYEQSVQSPDADIEFFEQAYREACRRKPLVLREDFCGTFAVCRAWILSDRKRTATGVDLCPQTLEWGRKHNLEPLDPDQRSRMTVRKGDVRRVGKPKADILAAQNFSFWIFRTRPEVIGYFRAAYKNLREQGIIVMDMMGGPETTIENHTEKRKIRGGKNGFSYLWEQVDFNPVNARCTFYIHFHFADGSRMERAFEYHWRFWSIPEVREMLAEAGFSKSLVYWETEDENGEDTGEWKAAAQAPNHPSWLCYIVGIK